MKIQSTGPSGYSSAVGRTEKHSEGNLPCIISNPPKTNPCDFNNLKPTTATRFNTYPYTTGELCLTPREALHGD